MIPLSQWLSDSGACPEAAAPLAAAVPEAFDRQALIDQAYERGRQDGLNGWAPRESALRAAFREELAEQEARLNGAWALHSASTVTAAAEAAFQHLRMALEQAVCAVLLPFLDEAIRARAAARLVELLAAEMAGGTGPILEIRAPALLHAPLAKSLEERGIIAALTESETIEIAARDGRSRFESMAQRWMAVLHETGS